MPHHHHHHGDDHEKSLRIKHEDEKLFTRLLSKESSKSNPSFRVYYGEVHVAVPFTWETCPGTPKHSSSSDHMIPPLTPPPSYFTTNNPADEEKSKKLRGRSRSKILLNSLLRRMLNPNKSGHVASPSHASSSSLSSSLSWSSSSRSSSSHDHLMMSSKRRRFSSWGSSFDDKAAAPSHDRRRGEEGFCRQPKSCFGIGGEKPHAGCSVFIVKKALLSIVGRGSA